MILDFHSLSPAVVPHFKGGEGEAQVRTAVSDGMGRILTLTLPVGSSIGLHTHTGNCEIIHVLSGSGVSAEKVEAFQQECRKQYGEDAELNPKNIIESGKFQITTPEVKIAVAPEYSYMIEARVIDGRKYILIPADDGVEINGIGVNIPNPQNTAE